MALMNLVAAQRLLQGVRPCALAIAPRLTAGRMMPSRMFSSSAPTMLVDGKMEPAVISVHDLTFVRGDGAFEVISLLPSPANSSHGVPVGMQLHVDRLESTCRSLRLPLVYSTKQIIEWVRMMGKNHGPGGVRVVLTRGDPSLDLPQKCIMLHLAPATYPSKMKLKTIAAPWHLGFAFPPLENPPDYSSKMDIDAFTTVKYMSYAPNCLMTRVANEHGADDALLLAADGRVLDGPNFAVGFVIDDRLRLVAAGANRMLPSCTQALAVQAANSASLPFDESTVHMDEVARATAAFALSATRHVFPIGFIDGRKLDTEDKLLQDLVAAYWRTVEAEAQLEAGL